MEEGKEKLLIIRNADEESELNKFVYLWVFISSINNSDKAAYRQSLLNGLIDRRWVELWCIFIPQNGDVNRCLSPVVGILRVVCLHS